MPRFDGTGPNGEGALTGRGLGECSTVQNNEAESEKELLGRGKGLGLGRGAGKGRGLGQGRGFGRRGNR